MAKEGVSRVIFRAEFITKIAAYVKLGMPFSKVNGLMSGKVAMLGRIIYRLTERNNTNNVESYSEVIVYGR